MNLTMAGQAPRTGPAVGLHMPQPMPDTVPAPQPDIVPPPIDLPQPPTPPEVQEPVLPGEHSPVSDPLLPGQERLMQRAGGTEETRAVAPPSQRAGGVAAPPSPSQVCSGLAQVGVNLPR